MARSACEAASITAAIAADAESRTEAQARFELLRGYAYALAAAPDMLTVQIGGGYNFLCSYAGIGRDKMQGAKTPQGGHAPGSSKTVIGANFILGNFCPWYESHECRVWLGIWRIVGGL